MNFRLWYFGSKRFELDIVCLRLNIVFAESLLDCVNFHEYYSVAGTIHMLLLLDIVISFAEILKMEA